jgi:hypothetical protein
MSDLILILSGALISVGTGYLAFWYQNKLVEKQFQMEKLERIRIEDLERTEKSRIEALEHAERLRIERRTRLIDALEKINLYYSEFRAISTLLDFTDNQSLRSEESYIRYMNLEHLIAFTALSVADDRGDLHNIHKAMGMIDESNIKERANLPIELIRILREEINRLSQ